MLTKQEMFDRAVRGLASQGWERAVDEEGRCQYQDATGKRCAWGWVDRSLDETTPFGSVLSLRRSKIGLAAELDDEHEDFAGFLQTAHDIDRPVSRRITAFVDLAEKYNLTWPSDVPQELPC